MDSLKFEKIPKVNLLMNNLKIYLDTGTNLQEVIHSQAGVVMENIGLGASDIFFDFTAIAFIMRCSILSGSEFSELQQITAINSSLVSVVCHSHSTQTRCFLSL